MRSEGRTRAVVRILFFQAEDGIRDLVRSRGLGDVYKRQVPIGTGDLVRDIINRHKTSDVGFDVVSNPEFLRELSLIHI